MTSAKVAATVVSVWPPVVSVSTPVSGSCSAFAGCDGGAMGGQGMSPAKVGQHSANTRTEALSVFLIVLSLYMELLLGMTVAPLR